MQGPTHSRFSVNRVKIIKTTKHEDCLGRSLLEKGREPRTVVSAFSSVPKNITRDRHRGHT